MDSVTNINQLRILLIGNKDLKHKLAYNPVFLSDLISGLGAQDGFLVDKLIVIRFLLKFDGRCLGKESKDMLNEFLSQLIEEYVNQLMDCADQYSLGSNETLVDSTNTMSIILDILSCLQIPNANLSKLLLVLLQINEVKLLDSCLNLLHLVDIHEDILFNLAKRLKFEINLQTNLKLLYKIILSLNYSLTESNIQNITINVTDDDISDLLRLTQRDNKMLNLNILHLLYLLKFDIDNNRLVELLEFNNYTINSFKILSFKIMKDELLVGKLLKIKIDDKLINYIVKLNMKTSKDFNLTQLFQTNCKDILLLLSLLTSTNEDFRLKFTKSPVNFKSLLLHIINSYRTLLLKFKTLDPKLLPILTDELFTNALYLIRSLSRSITVLRTFFIECHIADNLIDILKLLEIFKLSSTNKNVVMAILANLILDFTSFRYTLISNTDFITNLLLVYKNSLLMDDVDSNKNRLGFLQVVKNLMYNENEEKKIQFIDKYFNLKMMCPYLSYNTQPGIDEELGRLKLQQKIICFDILRNLTSNSDHFNQQLPLVLSKELNVSWHTFLVNNIKNLEAFDSSLTKFNDKNIVKLMADRDYVSMVSSINYIENHKFLTRDSFTLHRDMLMIWLKFLRLPMPKKSNNTLKTNIYSIKLSIIWILINLTCQDHSLDLKVYDLVGSAGFDLEDSDKYPYANAIQEIPEQIDSGGVVTRIVYLKRLGFVMALKNLQEQLKLDLGDSLVNDMLEKIKTVFNHLDKVLNADTYDCESPRSRTQLDAKIDKADEATFQPFSYDFESANSDDEDGDDYWVR